MKSRIPNIPLPTQSSASLTVFCTFDYAIVLSVLRSKAIITSFGVKLSALILILFRLFPLWLLDLIGLSSVRKLKAYPYWFAQIFNDRKKFRLWRMSFSALRVYTPHIVSRLAIWHILCRICRIWFESQTLRDNSGIDICSERKPADLEYADDAMLPSESPSKFASFLERVNDSLGM